VCGTWARCARLHVFTGELIECVLPVATPFSLLAAARYGPLRRQSRHNTTVLRLAAQQDGWQLKKLRFSRIYFQPLFRRAGGGGSPRPARVLGRVVNRPFKNYLHKGPN
jgi:hypothetical protein